MVLLAMLLAFTLVAAACGDDDSGDAADGVTDEATDETADGDAAEDGAAEDGAAEDGAAEDGATEDAAAEDGADAETPAEGEAEGDYLWVMVTDQAGLGDQGFNDLAFAGLEQAAGELGGEAQVIESNEQAQYVPNLQQAVDGGADMVVGVGFLIADAVAEVATANPDANFLLIDAVAADADGNPLPNVRSVTFKEHEAAYLAGVMAGLTTEANQVGFVGGIEIPPVVRFLSGFTQGMASVNPDATIETAYVGSFDDPARGKELTAAFFDGGADIVFEVAGAGGVGAYQEAVERGSGLVVGTDTCKDQLAPDNYLTSATKDVAGAVFSTAESIANGSFEGGIADLGLDGDFVGVCEATFGDLPQEVQDAVGEARAGIASGEIVVDPGV
jgi:basic membrane protein A